MSEILFFIVKLIIFSLIAFCVILPISMLFSTWLNLTAILAFVIGAIAGLTSVLAGIIGVAITEDAL